MRYQHEKKNYEDFLGIAKGKYEWPENFDIDECNDEIARMFGVTE